MSRRIHTLQTTWDSEENCNSCVSFDDSLDSNRLQEIHLGLQQMLKYDACICLPEKCRYGQRDLSRSVWQGILQVVYFPLATMYSHQCTNGDKGATMPSSLTYGNAGPQQNPRLNHIEIFCWLENAHESSQANHAQERSTCRAVGVTPGINQERTIVTCRYIMLHAVTCTDMQSSWRNIKNRNIVSMSLHFSWDFWDIVDPHLEGSSPLRHPTTKAISPRGQPSHHLRLNINSIGWTKETVWHLSISEVGN